VHTALETYSNVHRGSGFNAVVTSHLFDQARDIVLEYLGLKKGNYVVIFCTQRRAEILKAQLKPGSYKCISGNDTGLPLGVWALAVERKALPKGTPFQTGGGTTRLVSVDWVIWAKAPDKFEAGTPAIINIIAFAKALLLIQQFGDDIFREVNIQKLTAAEILYHDELEGYQGQELLDKLRHTLIGRSTLVPTNEGLKPFINFDNAASTPTFMPVWNAVSQAWQQPVQVQQEIVNEVKSICSKVLGAPAARYDVIITSNTTDAINLAAESLSNEITQDVESVFLNTFLEHSSNDLPWRMIPNTSLIRLPVDNEGFVDVNELETLLEAYNVKGLHGKKRIRLVAISGASNVLGVCNNLADISRIVHRFEAKLLVDAAQLVAHRKVDTEGTDIDYLAFSAHKVYAPFGCGVLVVKKGMLTFNSAELEHIRSSGEENIGGIAALGKALVLLQRVGLDLVREEEKALTSKVLHGMAQIPGLKVYGIGDPASPKLDHKVGVIVFGLKGMMADKVAKELTLRSGIGLRSGCHCAHIIIKRLLGISPGLEQFQRLIVTLFPKLSLPGLVRVSLGIENTEKDVEILIQTLGKIAGQPQIIPDKLPASVVKGTQSLSKSEVQQQIYDLTKAAALRVYSQPQKNSSPAL
jgi:selenocysteine lyase/cysteine desulfurase